VGVIADPGRRRSPIVDGRDEPPSGTVGFVREWDVVDRVEASSASLAGEKSAGLVWVFRGDVVVDDPHQSLRDRGTADSNWPDHVRALTPYVVTS
jgi:hypothetical protein